MALRRSPVIFRLDPRESKLLVMEKSFRRHRWLTAYAPLIVWTVVVLALGTSLGAMDETAWFIGPLLRWLLPDASAETHRFIHAAIRKFAHFAEYSVLAFLAWNAFRFFSRPVLNAFLLTFAVAFIDEFVQSFNSSRTSSLYDVLLDGFGAAFACCLLWLTLASRNFSRRELDARNGA